MTTQAQALAVRARVQAHRGEHDEAQRLAREAVSSLRETQSVELQALALTALGDVLAAAGGPDDAAVAAYEEAAALLERKQSLVRLAAVRARLADLRAPV